MIVHKTRQDTIRNKKEYVQQKISPVTTDNNAG